MKKKVDACTKKYRLFLCLLMENKKAGIPTLIIFLPTPNVKLMFSRTFINRLIIFTFMVVVGFCMAKALYHKSVIGFILALISLSAGVYFLHLLAKMKEEMQREMQQKEIA